MDDITTKRNTGAFSLAEISIVITIIALLMGSAYSVATSRTDDAKRKQTLAKMEVIEKAIASFVAINDRLPCPANIAMQVDNSSAGKEACWGQFSYTIPGGSMPANY